MEKEKITYGSENSLKDYIHTLTKRRVFPESQRPTRSTALRLLFLVHTNFQITNREKRKG